MKKICLFLFITCIVSANSMIASPVIDTPSTPTQISLNIVQYDLEILVDMLEGLGVEIINLEFLENGDDKQCTVTVRGTFNGVEIELVFVIKGMTCTEVLKALKT